MEINLYNTLTRKKECLNLKKSLKDNFELKKI